MMNTTIRMDIHLARNVAMVHREYMDVALESLVNPVSAFLMSRIRWRPFQRFIAAFSDIAIIETKRDPFGDCVLVRDGVVRARIRTHMEPNLGYIVVELLLY